MLDRAGNPDTQSAARAEAGTRPLRVLGVDPELGFAGGKPRCSA